MKLKGKVCLTIVFFMIIAGGIYFYLNQDKEEVPQIPVIKEESTVSGSISDIDENQITLQTQNQKDLVFSIDNAMKQGYETLALQDQIEILYEKDTSSNIQKAKKITMIKIHESKIEKLIDSMTLEEKIGQMIMARCPNGTQAIEDIETYHLGSYMLFASDVEYENKESLTNKLTTYQENSTIPMIFSIDEEGGTVNRLSRYLAFRGVPFHSPQDLYAEGGMDLILSDVKEKAELLTALGIQVNLAPVADVSTNEDDFINARAFGQDASATADYIRQVILTSKENHIGTTLKHFPGYGNNEDTHTGIAYDNRPYESFETSDFLPFQAGIDAGADSVLVSHNIVSSMDDAMPASLSKPIHDILRNELKFDGVIMSDDLDMQAIQQFTDFDTSAIAAIKAGNDMVLCSNYAIQIPAIVEAVLHGEIEEAQINASLKRILTWKANLQMLDNL